MNKFKTIVTTLLLAFIPLLFFGQNDPKSMHVTDLEKPDIPTKYAHWLNYVIFSSPQGKIMVMSKHDWNTNEIIGNYPRVASGRGMQTADNKIFYVTEYGNLRYMEWSSQSGWSVSNTLASNVNRTSDLETNDSESEIYYVGSDNRIRSYNLNSHSSQILVSSAPQASQGAELLWKGGRLYYIGQAAIHALVPAQGGGWQASPNLVSDVHWLSRHLAASSQNIYFIDRYRKIRSYGISSGWDHVVDPAAEAHYASDLAWIDGKLFFVNRDDFVAYLYWRPVTNWLYCPNFIQDADPQVHFTEVEKNVLLPWEDLRFGQLHSPFIHYFRAPIDPVSVSNEINKPCWLLIDEMSDEFDLNPYGNPAQEWKLEYSTFNHDYSGGPSWFYNSTDGCAHSIRTQGSSSWLAITTDESINVPNTCNDCVEPSAPNDCEYDYMSGMLHSNHATSGGSGFIEVRARVTDANFMKNAFWLIGYPDRREIDIFEVIHEARSMPTNTHNFDVPGSSDPFEVYMVCDRQLSEDFYTYGIEWNENEFIWYLNNEVVRRFRQNQAYPYGSWSNYNTGVLLTTNMGAWMQGGPHVFPNFFEIDYVRSYKPDPNCIKEKRGITEGNEAIMPIAAQVYPNPAEEHIYIDLEQGDQTIEQVELYALTGELMRQVDGGSAKKFNLPLEGLAKGVYVVRITTTEGVVNRKVVIQ